MFRYSILISYFLLLNQSLVDMNDTVKDYFEFEDDSLKDSFKIISDYDRKTDNQRIYLNDSRIVKINARAFEEIRCLNCSLEIYLQRNGLRNLQKSFVGKIKQVILLDLSFNYINSIETESLLGLEMLHDLYLQNNELEELKSGIFKDVRWLRQLNLSHNFISLIDYGAFNGLEKLETLDLSYNRFKIIEEDVFQTLKSLQFIDVSYNGLSFVSLVKFKRYSDSFREINLIGNNISCQKLSVMISYRIVNLTSAGLHNVSNINGIPCTNLNLRLSNQDSDKNSAFFQFIGNKTERVNDYLERIVENVKRNTVVSEIFMSITLVILLVVVLFLIAFFKKTTRALEFANRQHTSELRLL